MSQSDPIAPRSTLVLPWAVGAFVLVLIAIAVLLEALSRPLLVTPGTGWLELPQGAEILAFHRHGSADRCVSARQHHRLGSDRRRRREGARRDGLAVRCLQPVRQPGRASGRRNDGLAPES